MLPLQDQVCNLELSIKLDKLMGKRESAFYWSIPIPEKGKNEEEKLILQRDCEVMLCHKFSDWGEAFKNINAYTSAELGYLLKEAGPELTIKAYGDLYGYKGTGNIGSIGLLWLLTEPDRLGKMLCYLLENGLIPKIDKE